MPLATGEGVELAAHEQVTGDPILPGNAVEPLVNGDEAYPQMLAAIDEATTSVNLLSYIFDA